MTSSPTRHVNVDRTHKLIRRYAVTDAAEHDSRQLDGLLRRGNTSRDVFGDSAYRSAAAEARLKAQGFRSRAQRVVIRCCAPNTCSMRAPPSKSE